MYDPLQTYRAEIYANNSMYLVAKSVICFSTLNNIVLTIMGGAVLLLSTNNFEKNDLYQLNYRVNTGIQ